MDTADSKHDLPVEPNKIWASDISYIPSDEGFVFLWTYLDLFTRRMTGFAVTDHMRTELLMEALTMALGRQNQSKVNFTVIRPVGCNMHLKSRVKN